MTELDQLISDLNKAMLADSSREIFLRLLLRTIVLTGLPDAEIMNYFGLSRPTLARWKTGENSPHMAFHHTVYKFLSEYALSHTKSGDHNAT